MLCGECGMRRLRTYKHWRTPLHGRRPPPMFSTTDFRKGLKIEVEGPPYEIVDFQHFKPGKGGAMVRTKLRNILTQRMQDITFRSGEKVNKPDLETRDMQFLYHDGEELVFMDMTTYEQLQMSEEVTGGKAGF